MAKSKTKIPKKIAGIKIPKAIRKSALLDGILTDPAVREILADALVAAAGAAAAVLVEKRPKMQQIAETGQAVVAAGENIGWSARDLGAGIADLAGGAVGGAANSILPASLTRSDDASGDAQERSRKARKGRQSPDAE